MQVKFSATNIVEASSCTSTKIDLLLDLCILLVQWPALGLWILFITCTPTVHTEGGHFRTSVPSCERTYPTNLGSCFFVCTRAQPQTCNSFSVESQNLRKLLHSPKQPSSSHNPTLWPLPPYNLSLLLYFVKNYSSWVAESAVVAYPIYFQPFCALLGRVPRAKASLDVPLLLLFEAYLFSCVGASFPLVHRAAFWRLLYKWMTVGECSVAEQGRVHKC